MKNIFAVYSKKKIVTARQLLDTAKKRGIELRFMGMGSSGFHNEQKYLDAPLQHCLLIGAFESDKASLEQFDSFAKKGDALAARVFLNADNLPWCQIYTNAFQYSKTSIPYRKIIDSWSVDEDHSSIQSAKTQYLIENFTRRKNSQRLIEQLTLLINELADGIIVEHGTKPNKSAAKRPKLCLDNNVPRTLEATATRRKEEANLPSKAELKRNAKTLQLFAKSKSWKNLAAELNSGKSIPLDEHETFEAFARCALYDQAAIIEKFLDLGFDVNTTGNSSSLNYAIENLSVRTIRVLLERGANPNLKNAQTERTALALLIHHASNLSRWYATKRTEKFCRDDVNVLYDLAETRLASDPRRNTKFEEIATMLLQAGADPNTSDAEGFTAIDYLASAQFPKLIELLLAHNASLFVAQNGGKYALEQCVRFGDTETLKLLIKNGADVTGSLSTGQNARDLAQVLKHKDVQGILAKSKKAISVRNSSSATKAHFQPIPKKFHGVFRPDFDKTIANKKLIEGPYRPSLKRLSPEAFSQHYRDRWESYENTELEISEHGLTIRVENERRSFAARLKENEKKQRVLSVIGNGLLEITICEIKPNVYYFDYSHLCNDKEYDELFRVVWIK